MQVSLPGSGCTLPALSYSNISSPQRGISKQLWSSSAVAVPGTQQQSAIVVRKEHHRAYLQAAASATNPVVNAFVCRAVCELALLPGSGCFFPPKSSCRSV